MSIVLDGFPGAEGIATGKAHRLRWGVPPVPHQMVEPDRVEGEVARFHEGREWARSRIRVLQEATEERLGSVEARIFEPQLVMLDDPAIVEGTVRYVRENQLTAARAFEWRILELQAMWTRTAHPMVLDKLNDLEDLQIRLLHRLLGMTDPTDVGSFGDGVILVARNFTPSLTAQMDPEHVLGLLTDQGTRTSHWVMLARSLSIPAVIGLGNVTSRVSEGQEVILDGRTGRVIVDPEDRERSVFQERRSRIDEWKEELQVRAGEDAVTLDGEPVALLANLDLPAEAARARLYGAEGVGLFRTEFLVVGRNSMPGEEEQYQAYREVVNNFEGQPVCIRTFDLGGDKFPSFLHMPREENPFLGWRAVRVCLDEPELFRTQLRAALRATVAGDVRLMVPMVNDVDEISQVRDLLEDVEAGLKAEGIPVGSYQLGILVETPAAAQTAEELAPFCDFFSIGTNDLTQYTLAVDRTNARLASLFRPFHPSVVRQLHHVVRSGSEAGIEVGVCGEVAGTPLGAFLLLGLGVTTLSVAWPSIPEMKRLIREMRIEDARAAATAALDATTAEGVKQLLVEGLGERVDLSLFSGRWSPVTG